MGGTPVHVGLGEVSFVADTSFDLNAFERSLGLLGFGLLEDSNAIIVKKVKQLVEEVYSGEYDFPNDFRFADLITARCQKDYDSVSDLFIKIEKTTIKQYIIDFRINKVKEFLVYGDLTLTDIAFRLNFNSVAHLSAQFKQQTGLTPSFFKEVKRTKSGVLSAGSQVPIAKTPGRSAI